MPAPRKYPEKLKERAILLCLDALRDPERSKGCFRRIGEELDINSETLRGWVRQAQIDDHQRPGTTTDEAQRISELEKEILRRASAHFAHAEAIPNARRRTRTPSILTLLRLERVSLHGNVALGECCVNDVHRCSRSAVPGSPRLRGGSEGSAQLRLRSPRGSSLNKGGAARGGGVKTAVSRPPRTSCPTW